MERIQGFSRIPATGAPALGATITVYNTGTVDIATLYDDNLAAPTPKANPFTASLQNGYWFFYAAAGCYDIVVSGGGIPSGSEYTIADAPSGLCDGSIVTYNTEDLPATSLPHRGRLALVTEESIPLEPLEGDFEIDVNGQGATGGTGLPTTGWTGTPTITGGSGNYGYAWKVWNEASSEMAPLYTSTDEVANFPAPTTCVGQATLIVTDLVTLETLEIGPKAWDWNCV